MNNLKIKSVKLGMAAALILFLGCAGNSPSIPEPPKYSLLQKYQINESSLRPLKNGYVFFKVGVKGADIYYLDKNYNLKKKVTTQILIEPMKLKTDNDKVYILGVYQNRPMILVYDDSGKLIKNYFVGQKFDIPADIIDDKVLLTKYNNGSYINFGKVDLKFKDKPLTAKKVVRFNGGYVIFGTITNKSEDLFIAFVKNNRLIWGKIYDFGMDDGIEKVKVEGDKLYLEVYTTDYMGARTEYKIVLDKNGEIIKKSKSLEFKELPIKFRT